MDTECDKVFYYVINEDNLHCEKCKEIFMNGDNIFFVEKYDKFLGCESYFLCKNCINPVLITKHMQMQYKYGRVIDQKYSNLKIYIPSPVEMKESKTRSVYNIHDHSSVETIDNIKHANKDSIEGAKIGNDNYFKICKVKDNLQLNSKEDAVKYICGMGKTKTQLQLEEDSKNQIE